MYYTRPKYKVWYIKQSVLLLNDGTNYVPNHVSLSLIAKNTKAKIESQF